MYGSELQFVYVYGPFPAWLVQCGEAILAMLSPSFSLSLRGTRHDTEGLRHAQLAQLTDALFQYLEVKDLGISHPLAPGGPDHLNLPDVSAPENQQDWKK